MSSHETLSAAANDRKSRLAHLKSLKRKQAPTDDEHSTEDAPSNALVRTESSEPAPISASILSGRNYDPETRNVKLGFASAPVSDPTQTLEYKAEQLALETRAQQQAEETEDKPLDLFKLQPKKKDWDLKRDLEEKMRPLDVLTDNAIARLVRERVEGQKKVAAAKQDGAGGEREEVGMEGSELVEAMHLREKEAEEERKRERDEQEDVS